MVRNTIISKEKAGFVTYITYKGASEAPQITEDYRV